MALPCTRGTRLPGSLEQLWEERPAPRGPVALEAPASFRLQRVSRIQHTPPDLKFMRNKLTFTVAVS